MAKETDKAREVSPTRPASQRIHAQIEAKFGPDLVSLVDAVDPYTIVKDGGRFIEIMRWLRDDAEMSFDFLRSVAGVDYPADGKIASVYHVFSYRHRHAHVVKYLCDRVNPRVPSVESLWPTANWFERESYDLLGIVYSGHSDLRRILLPDDWNGHPLRKDYAEQADYHGIGTTRPSALDAFAQMDEARRKAREAKGEALAPPQVSAIRGPEGAASEGDEA